MSAATSVRWICRGYREADREAMLELFHRNYGELDVAGGEYFDWQSGRTPLAQPVLFPAARQDRRVRVVEITECGEHLAVFWERVAGKYPLMQVRDPAFLEWRYLRAPTRRYRLPAAHREGQILGIAAGRGTELSGMRCGMIVDLLVVPGLEGALAGKALVGELERGFRSEGTELLGALMLPHTQEFRLLRSARFVACPARFKPQPFPVIWLSHLADLVPPAASAS